MATQDRVECGFEPRYRKQFALRREGGGAIAGMPLLSIRPK
ncbi:hypothetical protein [Stenotrophomonas sp.]|nr:hypothetical protein [Stenotrophomonas sp.]